MTTTTLNDTVIAVIIFVGIILMAGFVTTTGFGTYDINDSNELDKFANAQLKSDVQTLVGDMEDADATSKVSDSELVLNPFSVVGKVFGKAKASKNIIANILNTLKDTLNFVPSMVWWLLGGIISIMLVFQIASAWFGRNIQQ